MAPRSKHREELSDFLRSRRTRIAPQSVGLRITNRRRTAGLRREEVAQLAGLSADWYARLEQGREVNPSRETLESIARVFNLDDDERGHLFYLAKPEARATPTAKPEQAMLAALTEMKCPAFIMGPRFDILAMNAAAKKLLIPIDELPVEERNMLWLTFESKALRARYSDIAKIERESIANFRFSASSFVGDPSFDDLIGRLLTKNERFRELWARHEVRAKTGGVKSLNAPGPTDFAWFTMASTTGTHQQLVFYVPMR